MPPERATPLSVAVVCWDLGHNALGRAHLLADMLSADHDVEMVGSHFPEFGSELWGPLRDTEIPVRRYPGGPFPGFFRTLERMAGDLTADVVYVVKPRLPGLGVGLLAKAGAGRPLVVDCDDLELSFVGGRHGLSLSELGELGDDPDFLRPQGRIWTSFSEWGVHLADAVTVCNVPLAARYGGTVVPHARDERVFDPERYDREEARARLGLTAEHRAVLFAGTPRRHKGIQQIAAALDRIGDRRNRLCVLATKELDELRPHIAGLEDWVHPVAPEPFSRLPQLLTAADAVCLLQDPASETARWQTPAKVSDALAMGVPCLTTRTPPLLPLVEEGGVVPVTEDDLDLRLESMLADAGARAEQARRGRDIFLRRFSYAAVRPRLAEVLRRAASDDRPPAADLLATVSFQRSRFTRPPAALAPPPRPRESDAVGATVDLTPSAPSPLAAPADVGDAARHRRPPGRGTVLAVVPYVDSAQRLDQCLESLVSQTRPPDGIVVVDDGTPEAPVGVVRRFRHVTLLRSARRVGPDRLVRQVIEETSADWYLLQDADGWSAPDRLERLLALATDSGAELLGSDYLTVVPEEGLTVSHLLPADVNAALVSATSGPVLHHRASLVHRSLVERMDGGSAAPWFSGGRDLVRRAAGVARVANASRVLSFERHRPPSPGADGDRPELGAGAGPTSLEQVCGPPPDRPSSRRVVSGPAIGRAVRRLAGGRVRAPAPTLVVGGPASGAETVLWSLAQHPSLVALRDLSWCAPAAEVVERAGDGGGAAPDTVRRALAGAMAGIVTDHRASRWIAAVPPAPALVRAVLAVYPEARLVHVVRDADETAAALTGRSFALPEPLPLADAYPAWLEAVGEGLECERIVGGPGVLRVRFDELVSRPAEVLARCLRFLGLREHPACGRLLEGRPVALAAAVDGGRAPAATTEVLNLSTALCGPRRPGPPGRRAVAAVASRRAEPPRPVAVLEPATPPAPPLLPAHVAEPVALLRRTLPPGAVVAVVSKGDSRFLETEPVKACHFPQTAWGEWAGYHPADTAEIVTHLRDLRRRGARYFLIPPFAAWWLDHYEGLREHLLASGSLVAESTHAGSLFALDAEPVGAAAPAEPPAADRGVEVRPARPRPTGSAADGFDVVMFWKQHDTGLYGRRHDMLMKHLARSPRVGQVVQFDAPVELASLRRRDPAVPTHHALLEQLAMARVGGVETLPGLHQHSFVYGGDRRGDRAFPTRDEYDVYVKDALARHGVGERPVVFWVYPNNFEFPELARAFGPDLIVADVVDDHRTWLQGRGDEEARVVGNYQTIARSADLVLVNCESMRGLMENMATNVHLVPNAADYPDPLVGAPVEIPDDLRHLRGPIVGYVGNLSSRIDVELLDRLATERPDWNLVLIGSAHAGRGIAPLARHRNVSLLGPRAYEEAKRHIRAFDVALIPHLDDLMTRAMNPLKAFVYCALHVPVVSTDIANLGELAPLVSVASDHDDFIAKVDAAIRAGRAPITPTADAVLRRNSWQSRITVITDLVDEALRRKAAG